MVLYKFRIICGQGVAIGIPCMIYKPVIYIHNETLHKFCKLGGTLRYDLRTQNFYNVGSLRD